MIYRKGFILGLVAVGAAILTGCGGDGGSTAAIVATTPLRFVNAVSGGQAYDFYVDNTLVQSNVTSPTSSTVTNVTAGSRTVVVTPYNSPNNQLISSTVNAGTGAHTYVVYGTAGGIDTLYLTDDTTALTDATKARVTVVHAAPAAGAVDVYVTTTTADLAAAQPVLTNLAPTDVKTLPLVASGLYRVRITPTGTKNVVIDSGAAGVTLAPNGVYNIFAVKAGTVAAPLTPFVQTVR